ncbi:MAG: Trk family potassium uptake protein [Clostridiales bacterium]|nr:Trk family potassium uptake protein [Clostridiales bacterium]
MTTFQIIALGFVLMILVGTLLLMLPVSDRQHAGTGFSDSLFTATSAVCVTGLVVWDTVTYWSPFGQAVILFLIQIGGMGVVTAALSLSFVSGRRIGFMQRSVLQEAISAPQVGGIVRLTRFIILTTLCIEGIGSVLLMTVYVPEFGWGKGVWYAVFHSVSAFCNAGFDLMGVHGEFSSMTAYAQNALVNIVLVLLITVGGIGFLVWNDVKEHGFCLKQYRLQSKIALAASGVMILIPFLWLLFSEKSQAPFGERVLPSLFQSVTLRTAGFNTMDLNSVSGGGQALMILWMLIGGSPGSTAGGMKTTTGAILLLTALAIFRRKDHVTCFGRRVGEDAVRNSVAILIMYFTLFFTGGLIISRAEGLPLMSCLFETASALGTVGLSLGITAQISTVSRVVLIALMFMGRVGGLTLIYAAQSVRRSSCSTLPLEKVTVG